MTDNKENSKFRKFIDVWISFSEKRNKSIIFFFLVLTVLFGFKAVQLRVDTDFKKLLPDTYPTVKQMSQAIKKIGELGYFSVVVENSDKETLQRYITTAAEKFSAHPDVRIVEYKNPVKFLNNQFYQFISKDQFEQLGTFLEKKRVKANPFVIDLEDDETEDKGADEEYSKDIKAAVDYYKELKSLKSFHSSDDNKVFAMRIRPRKPVTNLSFVRKMYSFLVKECESVKRDGNFPDSMRVYVGGSLKNKIDEYQVVIKDVVGSLWMAALLVLFVLIAYFRNFTSVMLLFIPLFAGLIWSAAFTAASVGFLNIISATLFTVLLGLGIDHGIHLLKRYQTEVAAYDKVNAAKRAFDRTGRATLISALTTAAGFLLLIITDFKGFSELGFIAGISMLLIISAYFILLPSLIFFTEGKRLFNMHKKFTGDSLKKFVLPLPGITGRRSSVSALVIIVILLMAGGVGAVNIGFDYDFTKLQAKVESSQKVKGLLHKVYPNSHTPGAVFFCDDDESLDAVLSELGKRKKADKESPTIGRIISKRNFIPKDPAEFRETVKETTSQITPLVLKNIKDTDLKSALKDLKESSSHPQAEWSAVPDQIKSLFVPQDGSESRIIFVYPSIERKYLDKAIMFADDIDNISFKGKNYIPTGDSLIMAAMVKSVVSQGSEIIILSLTAMFLMLLIQFRSLKGAVRIMISVFSGLSLMVLCLFVFNISVNFFNMVIIAVVIGMGIDASIHIYSSWMNFMKKGTPDPWKAALKECTGPVTASMLTTIAGYLGMLLSHHPGIQSIGELAVAGLGSCFIVSVTLFPLMLKFIEKRKEKVEVK